MVDKSRPEIKVFQTGQGRVEEQQVQPEGSENQVG
jgi:hypothetical protein